MRHSPVLPLTLAAVVFAATSSLAHLSVIRQGLESAGVPELHDHLGAELASGDFDGDGVDDLATASPDENNDVGGGNKHGIVVINYGTIYGLTDVSADEISIGAPADNDVYFGTGLAAGDFDDDGDDDLAVGAPFIDILSIQDTGQVLVYEGAPSGLSLAPSLVLAQTNAGGANELGDLFGQTLAAGDFNGDGYDDLAVGGIGEDSDAGVIFFFYGSAAGLTSAGAGWIKQSSLGGVNEAGGWFGFSLAAGDMLGTSHEDLAVGAPFRTVSGQADAGLVYILRGSASGLLTTAFQLVTAASVGLDLQPSSWFGYSLATGHVFETGGSVDLAVGEPSYDVGGAINAGRVVVVEYDNVPTREGLQVVELTQADTFGASIPEPADGFGWTLSAGDLRSPSGGLDGLDDLAVGAPSEDVAMGEVILSDVGEVDLFLGSSGGPEWDSDWSAALTSRELNDWYDFDPTGNERVGAALAFGFFDQTGRANLAIGAPDKDWTAYIDDDVSQPEAGLVHIYAPWRQPFGKPHRSSVVYDCVDRLVYSQRMDQRLEPASTTKALTCLIACEAIQGGEIDSGAVYVVPDWVADEIGGSQYNLVGGEEIRFIDLVTSFMAVSGNDCGFAIGDMLTPGVQNWVDYANTLPVFAARMNQRAAQLGMSGSTEFTNPSGMASSTVGDHWTTAEDMSILVRGAMDNALFRDIVGTKNWWIHRRIPFNVIFLSPPGSSADVQRGTFLEFNDDVQNGFFISISNLHDKSVGVKGGSTPPAKKTGLFSATLNIPTNRVTATCFGIPDSPEGYGTLYGLGDELLKLVDLNCNPQIQLPPVPPPPPGSVLSLSDFSTLAGNVAGASSQVTESHTGDLRLRVSRAAIAGATTNLQMAIVRASEVEVAPGETAVWGVDPFQRHSGLRIQNHGASPANLVLTMSHPASTLTILVPSEGEYEIAPYPPPTSSELGGGFSVAITNNSSTAPAHLSVEERGYKFSILLGDGIGAPVAFQSDLKRDSHISNDVVSVFLLGDDETGGDTVDLVGGAIDVVVSAPNEVPLAPAAGGIELSGSPNPFTSQLAIRFGIPVEGRVRLRAYDVSGRLVRSILDAWADSGRHELTWDGTDDHGRSSATGVYFIRLETDDEARTARFALIR